MKTGSIPPVGCVSASNQLPHKSRPSDDQSGSRPGSSASYSSLFNDAMARRNRDAGRHPGSGNHPAEETEQELDGLLRTLEESNTNMLSAVRKVGPSNAKTCIVPSTTGLSLHTAIGRLKMAQLKMGAIRKQYSFQFPAGHIISQTPQPGSTAFKMTGVSVTISKGPPPELEKYDAIRRNKSIPFFRGSIGEEEADEFGRDGVFIEEETATL